MKPPFFYGQAFILSNCNMSLNFSTVDGKVFCSRPKYHYNTKKLHFLPKTLFWDVVITTLVENYLIFGLKYR